MTLGDLVPWSRHGLAETERSGWTGGSEWSPFVRLHQEMNRLFDDAFRGFEPPALRGQPWPSLEVEETDEGYRVTAELPGIDEKDVEVSVHDGVLSIRGEKRMERENKGRTVSERYYGRFERRVALDGVDEDRITARFEKGMLTVDAPRSVEAQRGVKRIPINAAEKKAH